MSEKGRIAVIFGALGVLVGGGLFYFFGIHQPAQQRAAAQAEVGAWEERWGAARGCLLGPAPASANAGEALAIREMLPDPWERGTCTKLIARLNRGVAEDTGLMKVEHAWMTIDRAAAKVAGSFATHVDPYGEALDQQDKPSPLPGALEALDAAHAELRAAAGMGPPASASGPALPAATLIPVQDGTTALTSLAGTLLPSAGGVVGFGRIEKVGEVQLVLAPGAAPRIAQLSSGVQRAVPDLAWGAIGLMSQVSIGTIDPAGTFGAMTSLPTASRASVQLAVGSFADGFVMYGASGALTFARARDGAFVAAPPIDVDRFAYAIDPTGRGLVAWSDGEGAMHGVIAQGGLATPSPVELGSGAPYAACLTATHGWIASDSQFVAFDAAGARPHLMPRYGLIGCTANAALLSKVRAPQFAVCADTCRMVELPGLRPTELATLAGDKVVAIGTRENVLGVWHESGPPTFHTLPERITPERVISDGKVIDVLATTKDAVVIVRVPAP